MLGLPGGLQPGDGRRRQPRCLRPEQRLEDLGEVAGADPFEVEQGGQPLQAPGLPQVGREDRRDKRLPLVGGPAVTDPGLLDLDGSDAGLDGPLGQMTVADDLASSVVVLEVGVAGGDLGLDGLGQQASSPAPEEVGEHVLAGGQGHDADLGGRRTRGGVLLSLVGHRCEQVLAADPHFAGELRREDPLGDAAEDREDLGRAEMRPLP